MEQRNIILAFGLSMLILLGWGSLFPPAEQPIVQEQITAEQQEAIEQAPAGSELGPDEGSMNSIDSPAPVEKRVDTVTDTVFSGETISFSNDLLELQVNEKGWLVAAKLAKYKESKDKDAKSVSVLGKQDMHSVHVSAGIMREKGSSLFKLVSKERVNGADVLKIRASLADGRIWERTMTLIPGSYLVELEDSVQNGAGLKLFRQVVERYPNRDGSTFYEYAGPVGLVNDVLQEPGYDDLDESGTVRVAGVGGWTGVMDRYFITALYGDQSQDYRYYYIGDGRSYQAGMIDDGVMDGATAVFKSNVYIGPKLISELEREGAQLERSVDYGWFAFIAKPLHEALSWFYKYVPNYGWCIILLLIGIKIIFFYPTQKSYQSMAAMRKIQPEQKRLQERFGDDKQKLGQEMMGLYKKHKVNPLGGCLPIIIQIPVFFALYKVLLMSIEMRHAPFIGWIQDLSAQDPYFILPLLMGASMYIQQKLNPQPPDPMQAKIMSFLPVVFTVMFLFFPSGLVLYWVVNNVLSIAQQRLVMRKMGVD